MNKFVCVWSFHKILSSNENTMHTHTTHTKVKGNNIMQVTTTTEEKIKYGEWFMDRLKDLLIFLRYLKSLRWINDITRWIQDSGALIAESAFTLSLLYVMIFKNGHLFIVWMPDTIVSILNQLAMITFTILPEIVMIPIFLTTFDLFGMGRRTKDKKNYIWGGFYAALTICFAALTLLLLYGLRNGFTVDTTPQTTGGLFVLRCFTGLFYTLLQRIWDRRGKNSYTSFFDKMQSNIDTLTLSLSESNKQNDTTTLALSKLQEEMSLLQSQLEDARLALLGKKITRKSAKQNSNESDNKVPTGTNKITPINIQEKMREKIIEHTKSGKGVNVKIISKEIGVSYGTARKYAATIMKEISQELPAMQKEG